MAWIRKKLIGLCASRSVAIFKRALERITQLYAIKEEIGGQPPDWRREFRRFALKPLLKDLDAPLLTLFTRQFAQSSLVGRLNLIGPHSRIRAKENAMARTMTEQELLEFFEINWRLIQSLEAGGHDAAAHQVSGFLQEIERHLYRFSDVVVAEQRHPSHFA